MALFKNLGKSQSRALDIISEIKPIKKEETQATEKTAATGLTETIVSTEAKATEIQATETKDKTEDTSSTQEKSTETKNKTEDTSSTQEESTEIKPDVLLQPEAPKITDEAMYNYLSEKLNRKIESIDDLTIREEKELDPEVKQLLEWKEKTGLSLSKWSDYNKDFSKMGDLDMAREILSKRYPNFNSEELNYKLKDFIYNEKEDDETDRIKKSIALKTFSADGRRELEANQLKLVSTEGQILTSQQEKDLDAYSQIQQNQSTVESNQTQYMKDLSSAAMSLEALNLKLSDDLTINYDISEGDRKTLPKEIAEMPHWYNSDGSMNHSNIARDGLIIRDFDTIVKKVYEQGVSVGQESKIKADNNITIDTQTQPVHSGEDAKKGNINDVIDSIAGNRSGRKLRFGRKEKN